MGFKKNVENFENQNWKLCKKMKILKQNENFETKWKFWNTIKILKRNKNFETKWIFKLVKN